MLKHLGNDFNHSPLSSVKVRNEWSHSPARTILPHGVDGKLFSYFVVLMSQDSSVGPVNKLCVGELRNCGLILVGDKRFFSSPEY